MSGKPQLTDQQSKGGPKLAARGLLSCATKARFPCDASTGAETTSHRNGSCRQAFETSALHP